MFKKIISCALIAAMMLTATACGSESAQESDSSTTDTAQYNDYIMNIGDNQIYLDEFKYYYLNCKDYLSQGDSSYFSNDSEKEEALKSQTLDAINSFYVVNTLIDQLDIEITPEISKFVDEKTKYTIEQCGGKEEFEKALALSHLTEDLYRKIATQEEIYNNIFQILYEDDMLLNAKENFIHASHILVLFDEGETSQAHKDKKLAEAQSILEEVQAGETEFSALIAKYGEDPGQNPEEGYYFAEGTMVDEFYNGAKALGENEVSEIIESTYGYHIIKRLPIENEYVFNNPFDFLTDAQKQDLSSRVESIESSLKTEFSAEYDKISSTYFE